jgi:hypothetical protein
MPKKNDKYHFNTPKENNLHQTKEKSTSGDYHAPDRIMKENAAALVIPLAKQELKLDVVSFKEINVEFAKTIERRADFLCEIETKDQQKQILHIEFQSSNNSDMLSRMQEYDALLQRKYKYKYPIKHLVVYMGKGKANMRTQLAKEHLFTGFKLVSLNTMDSNKLLKAEEPELVILALLGKHVKKNVPALIEAIIHRLKALLPEHKDKRQNYLAHLTMLAKLRKLEEITHKIISNMPVHASLRDTFLYKEGEEASRLKHLAEKKQMKKDFDRQLQKKERTVVTLNKEIQKIKREKQAAIERAVEKAKQEKQAAAEKIKQEKQAAAERARQQQEEQIKNFLQLGILTMPQIASAMNVSLYRVRKVKKSMCKKIS